MLPRVALQHDVAGRQASKNCEHAPIEARSIGNRAGRASLTIYQRRKRMYSAVEIKTSITLHPKRTSTAHRWRTIAAATAMTLAASGIYPVTANAKQDNGYGIETISTHADRV